MLTLIWLQHNTVCEEIDISDNYVDQEGATALADMMKENMFIVSLVSTMFIASIVLIVSTMSRVSIMFIVNLVNILFMVSVMFLNF